MKKEELRERLPIVGGAVLFLVGLFLPAGTARLLVFLACVLVCGGEVYLSAGRNLLHGELFDENFLMALASIGAFCIGETAEAAAVMLFYQVGEALQDAAVERSRGSIAALMALRADTAFVLRGGEWEEATPENVAIGEILRVRPGERIPLDGIVTEGSSSLDTSALTGEPLPQEVSVGDKLLGGCINLSGMLLLRVTSEYAQSTVGRILALAENAGEKKARAERFITRFARVYTPVVVIAAILLAFLPPLFGAGSLRVWIARALNFLVISCPCALVISVPLGFFCGIGAASKLGVLVKSGSDLETLAKVQTVVFDKTGTLTEGRFSVEKIVPQGLSEAALLCAAAHAESASAHPIARSLLAAYGKAPEDARLSEVQERTGFGVTARLDGVPLAVGSEKLLTSLGVTVPPVSEAGAVIHVAIGKHYAGYLTVADTPREGAKDALAALRALGVSRLAMLTGDRSAAAAHVADVLELDEFHAELLPADKVAELEKLLESKAPKSTVAFVGDGMNDAPVMARADLGVAMGALGTDAAMEAADMVLMTDELQKLPGAIRLSRAVLRVVRENIGFALGVKLLILLLSSCGLCSMWAAVFADVGVAALCAGNSLRILGFSKKL